MSTEAVILYDERHKLHQTRKDDPCENGDRVELVKKKIEASSLLFRWEKPSVSEQPLIFETHAPMMLRALQRYSSVAEPGDEIFTRYYAEGDYYHSTPITKGTYRQALISACCAIDASNFIARDETPLAISLSRPPGHHAGRNFYHGFCFINNAALAARTLYRDGFKTAILDFDVHHGDGTQDIFYSTGEALYVSIHLDPNNSFPATGFEHEQGEGKGLGLICNLPIEKGTSSETYKTIFDKALQIVRNFNPDAVVLSAGFDAHKDDYPPGGQSLTQLGDDDYGYLGYKIGTLKIPCCVVLEGGYNLKHLPLSVVNFLEELHPALLKGKANFAGV